MKLRILLVTIKCLCILGLSCSIGLMTLEAVNWTRNQLTIAEAWAINKLTIVKHIEPICNHQDFDPIGIATLISDKAKQHNIDYRLLSSLIEVESKFDPDAISPAGAMGLMQLMPEWKNSRLCPELKHSVDFFKPELNLDCGIKILKSNLKEHGSIRKALRFYNGSASCEARSECKARTEQYAQNIIDMTLSKLVKQG
jgi:soluble lytic murein transglycosylase-like protein